MAKIGPLLIAFFATLLSLATAQQQPPTGVTATPASPFLNLGTNGATNPQIPTQPSRPNMSALPAQNDPKALRNQTPNAYIIEDYKAERMPVYPADPNSAWWEVNVREAFKQSQREMKPLLLLFTSMFSPEAMELSSEVFSTKSFNNYAKENLIICYLIYPRKTQDAPKTLQWAKKEFKILDYPNVLIFNPKGEVQRSIRGYKKGRPVDYFNDLKAACAPALESIIRQKKSLARHGYRDWHNDTGKVMFARFIRRDDLLMTLRDGRGEEWTIAIENLTQKDQMMARSFPRLDEMLKQK